MFYETQCNTENKNRKTCWFDYVLSQWKLKKKAFTRIFQVWTKMFWAYFWSALYDKWNSTSQFSAINLASCWRIANLHSQGTFCSKCFFISYVIYIQEGCAQFVANEKLFSDRWVWYIEYISVLNILLVHAWRVFAMHRKWTETLKLFVRHWGKTSSPLFVWVPPSTKAGIPAAEDKIQMHTFIILALRGVRKSRAFTGWHTAT